MEKKEYHSILNVKEMNAEFQNTAFGFDCGNSFINHFLKSNEAVNKSFGKTFIWLADDNKSIIGFYNISVGSIDIFDGVMRYKMGGAVHINEFAIHQKYQKVSVSVNPYYNFSDMLLNECIERIKYIRSRYIGFSFVTLQSTHEGYKLYCRHDFEDLDEDMSLSNIQGAEWKCRPMYLALDVG